MNQVKEQLGKILEVLAEHQKTKVMEVPSLKMMPSPYKKAQNIPAVDDTWQNFKRFDRVQGRDKHFWFYTEIDTPDALEGQELYLTLTTTNEGDWDATNPQGLLYLNGEIACGLDINHREYPLKPNTHYQVFLYFYVGMIESHVDVLLDITATDLRTQKLYYDLLVPYQAALCYPDDHYTNIRILKALELTVAKLDLRNIGQTDYYRSIEVAEDYLQHEFYEKECGNSDVIVNYLGHTHIDVAWLWTLGQTREKVQRTFSSMLYLLDRYPEFIFFTSQPQLLKYLKEEAPALYEKVKQRAKEGRFEVDGAMWLEADCNLSSGESLVRQIAHGKKFMKDEFNVDSKTLWLPDVFGYSAALPQILKKSGVNKFVTSKISWNEENKMPYDTFLWQGIDGTEVFTYFLTAQDHKEGEKDNRTTYVGVASSSMNLGTWERYQQKEYNNETIVTMGHGDGGGGTTKEMLEYVRRLSYGLPGQPKAQFSRADDFLNRVEKNFYENAALLKRMPKWVGELYLEFHRGTYTSIAKNKKNNRDCEFLLENAETLNVLAKELKNAPYTSDVYYKNWETVLLNQFHDIIPGSSIREVYEESDLDYARVKEEVGKAYEDAARALTTSGKDGYLLFNPNGFETATYVKTPDGYTYVEDLPSMGVKYLAKPKKAANSALLKASQTEIDTPFYHVDFNDSMQFVRLFDKENKKEVLAPNQMGNVLRAFENQPHQYDNWELFRYHQYKFWDITEVKEAVPFVEGETCGVRVTYAYDHSTVSQTIRFYLRDRRIDFETTADWHADHQILKAVFPVDVLSNEATFEIQYGNAKRPTHRNTSWDEAKFEICAQKWADLSEEGYGVALLNNCKYGYSVTENVMTISLIKTGTYPNEVADQGAHEFTYALLPHEGSFTTGDVIREAYLLNRPVQVMESNAVEFNGADSYAFASCDAKNIVLECAKEAEDHSGNILRLYDTWNKRTEATIHFGKEAKEVWLCDLLENPIEMVGKGKDITIPVKNFEIITLLVRT